MCVSFFSYWLASALDSLGNQKPECICIPNSPYHHRTEALICFSAMDYRNQTVYCLGSLVCVLFLPLLWRALKHFTGEHWKSEKRSPSVLQLLLHCHHCSRGNADPPVSLMIRGWTGWFLSKALSCSRALEPHPIPLPQLSDVHAQIPTQSIPTAQLWHMEAHKKPRQLKSCCYL